MNDHNTFKLEAKRSYNKKQYVLYKSIPIQSKKHSNKIQK